jgi:negative regulator of sigma-B (phosphoserine phosphatase)
MGQIGFNIVEWGVAGKQMPGETHSGDLHLVKMVDRGVLLAVADGLGHGKEAAEAAKIAIDSVEAHSHEPLIRIIEYCGRRLRESRGAAMSLALFSPDDNSMEWLGVGNVGGVLIHMSGDGKRANEFMMLTQGVVGVRLPTLRTSKVGVIRGDTLVVATDGIRRGFEEGIILFDRPDDTAQSILERDGQLTDDALVLVAKYTGRPQ